MLLRKIKYAGKVSQQEMEQKAGKLLIKRCFKLVKKLAIQGKYGLQQVT